MESKKDNSSWLERPIHPGLPAITYEVAIFTVIILAGVVIALLQSRRESDESR